MNKIQHTVLVCLSVWLSWYGLTSIALADGPAVLHEEIIPLQLVIPVIDLDSPIVPVGLGSIEVDGQAYPIWETAENEVGWHQGSGPPGQVGNTVLAGHSNGGREIFRRLEEVQIGDELLLATTQGWYRYQVADKFILREQGEPVAVRTANARWILPTEDERLTLITCWPYPSSTHRLFVIAHPVSSEPEPEFNPQSHINLQSQPEPTLVSLQPDPIFTPHTGLEPQPASTSSSYSTFTQRFRHQHLFNFVPTRLQ